MKLNKSKIIFLIIATLAVGLIYFIPNVVYYKLGSQNNNLIYAPTTGGSEEGFGYVSRIREAMDGDFLSGDPALFEYKQSPNIWGTALSYDILAFLLPSGILGVNLLLTVGDFIFPSIIFIAVFFLAYGIIKKFLPSVFISFVSITFPNLFVFKTFFTANFYKEFSLINLFFVFQRAFNDGLSRILVPAFYLVFFFLFLLFLYESLSGKKKYIFLSGFSLGLLFYFYFYYWAFSLIAATFLLLFLFIAKNKKECLSVLQVLILAGIVSVPYWIRMFYLKSFPLYDEYFAQLGVEYSRSINWQSLRLYIAVALLSLICFYFWYKDKKIKWLFLMAMLFTLPAVLNLQIISGFNIQSDHWGSRINAYILTFVFLNILYFLAANFLKRNKFLLRYCNAAILAGLCFFVGMAILAQINTASATFHYSLADKNIYSALLWLDKNSEKGEVVVSPDINLNNIILTVTHNNIYSSSGCMSLASQQEIQLRFLEANAAFGVNEGLLRYYFKDGRNPFLYLYCLKYWGGNLSPKEESENILASYRLFKKNFNKKTLKFTFKADYLLYGPQERLMGDRGFKIQKYSNLKLIYFNDSVSIYKILTK